MVVIVACLLLGWEGLKWLGKYTDYGLEIGSATIDLNMTRDVNMPHLRDIFGSFTTPAQRNGPPLIEVLMDAALNTGRRALVGFAMGTSLGLLLAVIFVHFRIL